MLPKGDNTNQARMVSRIVANLFVLIRVLFVLLFVWSRAYSKEVGGAAGDIWTFGAGARSLGLANATMELADDATAGYWQPARLAYVGQMNFNFLNASLFEGAAYQYMGLAYPTMALGTIGLNLVRLGIGDIEQRDDNNNLVGNFDFSTYGLGLGYGNQFGSRLAFGGNLKYLSRSLPGASSSLLSFDLAADYRVFKFGEVGVMLRDVFFIGQGTEDKLPVNAALGMSYGLFEGALKLTAQLEQKGPVFRAGLEYGLGPAALRMGLGGANQTTAGMGFRYQNIQFDYAILIHELGNSNRFSLGFWFGQDRSRQRRDLARYYFDKSVEAYKQGQFLKAFRLMDKGLAFNPGDAILAGRRERMGKVISYLRLTREEMKRPSSDAPEALKQKYAYTVRGLSDYVEANLDNAVLLLRQGLAIDPSDEGLRKIYTNLIDELGRPELKEQPLLSPAAQLGSKLSEADRYFRTGRFDLAAKACEDVIRLDPRNALAFERLGSAYFALGLRDKAVEMWNKSVEINPNNRSLQSFLQRFGFLK